MAEDALLTTLDVIALVKLRLASGENKDGGRFSDYSTLYAQKRANSGLQTEFKDFNVSGRLYASILPEAVEREQPGETQVDIIVKGEDNENKVAGQFKRDGNIIEPSESEISDTVDAWSKRRINRANSLFSK
jgi:hypothetical protein